MPFTLGLNKVYEVKVIANVGGQQIVNVFHLFTQSGPVDPGALPTSDEVLLAWRTKWRTLVLPLVVFPYQVKEYNISEVTNVAFVPPSGSSPGHYELDYGASDVLIGIPFTDASARILDPQPSFTAISVRVVAFTLAGIRIRGAKRFGPIAEEDTSSAAGGQELMPVVFNSWNVASAQLYAPLHVVVGAAAADPPMVILSRAWAVAGGGAPINGVGIISDVILHSIAGSQVSRKISFVGG